MSEVTEQQLEDMEALFVQTGAAMTCDGDTLTLKGLSPSTLYFADRPQREVGQCRPGNSWPTGDRAITASPRIHRTRCCRSWSRTIGLLRMPW